jgi:hypothetical protein
MIALSSHSSDQDRARSQIAGFGGYIAKVDRDTLISTLTQTIGTMVNGSATIVDQ